MREMMIGICRKDITEEVKKQLWLAVPMVFASVFQYSLQMISLMFIGHLDDEVLLAGASLANSFMNVIGISVLRPHDFVEALKCCLPKITIGFACALETFCGQSFGAQKYHMVGIHLQRAILINMLLTIPQSIIMLNLKPILIFLHQDPKIATEAELYGRYLIPNILASGILKCIVKFLQTQNIVFPLLVASGITSLLHCLNCWIWIVKLRHGIKGAAIATCMSNWTYTVLLVFYIKFSSSCKSTWTGFSRESLHNIPQFLRIAFPSAIMVCLESWMYEIMVLLSGTLPNPKLQTSVLAICMNIASVVWMLSSGFTGAASIRVSNELGAGNPRAAHLAVCVVVVLNITEAFFVGTVMILLRNIWGYAYTKDIEVVKQIAIMLPILAVSYFLDSLQSVLGGIARGSGLQKAGAVVNLGSCYLVGIPAAIIFAFVLHIGVKGLWLGILCAVIAQAFSLMLITLRLDWEKEANKARDRVYKSITPESLVT
ncbi:protein DETOXIFICATION 16 isoform X2 [Medicago truncatula]|uniref:protein DETOXIFICATION 16 isoform X2 n=1 Tax=Medicago truncatula TaxID=3880 RepID=UPI000D2F21FB|nr:protein DETOXIFICATION 16 isoform X2 [Medicago truncatula]